VRKLAAALIFLVAGAKIAEACGPFFVLRAGLELQFWQPYAKTHWQLLGLPGKSKPGPAFAGMGNGGKKELEAARKTYQEVERWRAQHFEAWDQQPAPLLADTVAAARRAIDAALAARPSEVEAEELRLLKGKVTLREGESLLVMSRTKVATPVRAGPEAFQRAREEFAAFVSGAKSDVFRSEGRGWLARCHYLLGEPHKAAAIYLDELDNRSSTLDRRTLLQSLALLFPYNGSAAGLADHLEDYFDTPSHALYVLSLVTNPVVRDENERRSMAAVGQKALDAIERHKELFAKGEDSDRLALATMRAHLYRGDLRAALRIDTAGSRSLPETRWMRGIAYFLMGEYQEAEPHLLAVADSKESPERARTLSRLGLLVVYQKLGRPVDQLLMAFRHQSGFLDPDDSSEVNGEVEWFNAEWDYDASLLDLPYLLDIQLDDAALEATKQALARRPPIVLNDWDLGKTTAAYLVDYALAVRASRRGEYAQAAAIYEAIGVPARAARSKTLVRLAAAVESAPRQERLHRRFELASYLADNTERILFNDILWHRMQTLSFLRGGPRSYRPAVLSETEMSGLVENERKTRDAQEERWQAFLMLDGIVQEAGGTPFGRRAALKAIECLDRINTDRFEREKEIKEASARLVAWLAMPAKGGR